MPSIERGDDGPLRRAFFLTVMVGFLFLEIVALEVIYDRSNAHRYAYDPALRGCGPNAG